MNVTAFLRKTKNKTKATVYFRVRDNECNCDLKAASELSIHPQHWDNKRMGYKVRVSTITDEERLAFNSSVQELIKEISRTYFKGATSEWLKKTIFCFHHPQAYKLEGTKCVEVRLSIIIDQYIERKDFDKQQRIVVHSLVGKVERFEQYQRQIKKKKNYTMNVDTITTTDLTDLY
ncbi:integrase, partial [Akkermansia sp. BIOML-A54]